ncbi:MAG TPA: SDR family oxidoreductase [bacterium]|nr:SDR family oxidoreductase [bacterium]
MNNRSALITGASSDIGVAVAQALVREGYDIAAHCYKNQSRLTPVNDEAEIYDGKCAIIQRDLKQPGAVEDLVAEAVVKCGGIDVLVNTIGPFQWKDLLEVTPQEWEEQVFFNLNLAFRVTHAALPHLRQRRGHIINFVYAGVENIHAQHMATAYYAAKSGLLVLTKSLAARLAQERVRVNAVGPGLIADRGTTKAELARMAKRAPFGRPGTTVEIAEIVRWLVADSPAYVTGTILDVAGGWEF